MAVFDYKKAYKEFYLPPQKPGIVEIPRMHFAAVRGQGDPNEPDGAYKTAIGLLYKITFTVKMSYRENHKIDGYFPYTVPPLEGLWRQDKTGRIDYTRKEDFQWICMIRLPDFVTEPEFEWAVRKASEKKQADFSKVEFMDWQEGLCVQCMHVGGYDSEPATIAEMDRFLSENGYAADLSQDRPHHEIYLSDPRRCASEKLRTVIRHPVKS
ncbi:MAG TPA: transcriptional regulator [Lachnospiraceae bacterium]|nr:transcriptional regulator [Lachnospiraceae bacterium]